MIRRGFTLIEMVVVVMLIGIVAAFAAYRMASTVAAGRVRAAEADLETLRAAFVGSPAEPGLIADLERLPGFSPCFLRVGNLFSATNLWGGPLDRGSDYGVRGDDLADDEEGYARFSLVTNYSPVAGRGWRGPYARFTSSVLINGVGVMAFPEAGDVRSDRDTSFASRGFFPDVRRVAVPSDFQSGADGCSIYGYPGEWVPGDPWGNPYVLQVPPAQAFIRSSDAYDYSKASEVPYDVRFQYARLVSAGPDGVLETPCFSANATNATSSTWTPAVGHAVRLAGRSEDGRNPARGDDIVVFLNRNDVYEDE